MKHMNRLKPSFTKQTKVRSKKGYIKLDQWAEAWSATHRWEKNSEPRCEKHDLEMQQ